MGVMRLASDQVSGGFQDGMESGHDKDVVEPFLLPLSGPWAAMDTAQGRRCNKLDSSRTVAALRGELRAAMIR